MSFSLVFLVCLVTTTAAQTTESNSGCGAISYYGPSGVISSPNYPGNYYANLDCNYDVYSSTGSSFSFIFKSFNTEINVDYVTISCPTNSSFTPQRLSGKFLPVPVSVPWCSQGRVNFVSDYSLEYSGFTLDYFVSLGGCGNTLYGGSSGYFTSPGFPNDYAENQNCSNIILASTRSRFSFYFQSIDLPACEQCTCDWVELSCFDNDDPSNTHRYCGYANSVEIYQCTQVLVWFHSNETGNHGGFQLSYSIYPDTETTTTTTSTATNTTTTPPTSVASTTDFTQTAPPGCGFNSYYGPSGVISSPNYPGNYDNMLDCDYNVYGSVESTLTFIFSSFHVENVDFVTISCPINPNFPAKTYSGHALPDPLSIKACSHGLVSFHSDSSIVSTGFSLDYYVSEGGCGNTLFTGANGSVISPDYPYNYGYNQDCSNVIWVPLPSTVHLRFRYFDLENCTDCRCDWLEISCQDNSESGPERYCRNRDNHMLYVYRCSQVLLWFHSDGTNNNPGFQIEYNISPDGGCGAISYYGPSGIISSPNYPGIYYDNLDCNYDVYSSTASSFSFFFKSFNTETYVDYVTISCPTNSSFPPQTYSGQFLPDPVSVPWCSQGRVRFSTDDDDQEFSGFSLDYFVSVGGCGNTLYGGSQGSVTSPGFPNDYKENLNCSNIIWASTPSHYSLNFLLADFPNCEQCTCDWVEISCLDNNPSDKHRFCYDVYPLEFSHCTQVLVWFHSSGSYHEGFYLQYNVYPETENTTTSSATTTSTTTTTPMSLASTVDFTQTATQSTHAPADCGDTSYYGPSGVISSPNHPGNYSNDLSCDYYVNATSLSSSIAIIFEAIDTEECCDYVTISCPTNPVYPSGRYSGSTLPQPLSIPWCSAAVVNFITDSSTVSTGFSLDFHISLGGCGDTVYTGSNGEISSPNYPNSYDNNQNCSNIIWTRLRSSFSITFLYMNVEECCDFVELSCLDNAEYGSHRFTGTTIPPKQTIPQCTQVLVWFYSDDTTVHQGFSLDYSATPDSE